MSKVTNVVIAGLGGQGVLKVSDILAEAALRAGFDVKKSELHGMSQRGGSVSSDVRYGEGVLSPMVPCGEADYLIVLSDDQVERNVHVKKPSGMLIAPDCLEGMSLPNKKCANVVMLGVFSTKIKGIPDEAWFAALRMAFPDKLVEINEKAFNIGRGICG